MPESPAPAILLVEDEFASLEVLGLMLEAKGYRVVGASDGEEALRKARETAFDLVITDYMMPKMTGTALCAELAKDPRFAGVPVIMVSAHHPDDIALPTQAVAFFRKPLLFDRLLQTVRTILPLTR